MSISGLHVTVIDLNHSDAPLYQAPRDQATPSEVTLTILLTRGGTFLSDVESIHSLGLHAKSDFH